MKFAPTPEMIEAAGAVFLAKAHLALIEPVVTAYERQILASGKWLTKPEFSDESPRAVVEPKDAWLMAEGDFAVYDAQCKAARVRAGLYVENPDHCPKLVAEDHVRQAERGLVDALEPLTGLSADKLIISSMANYRKYVDLSLNMMAPFVDRDEIMGRVTNHSVRAAGPSYERPSM